MVNAKKQQLVKSLAKEVQEYSVIGVVNLENLPAQQLQKMRGQLRKKGVQLRVARKRLLHRALDGAQKEKINDLQKHMNGVPAFLLSNENPFTLYATLQKSKSEAAAKPGQIAPKDLMVKAGPTNFAPGPIISELAAVGIKTKVEQGKLSVISDTTLVKMGEVISQKVSETLKRLDIKPMEIGLNVVAVWEKGTIFTAAQLHIDEAEFARNITTAAQWAFNLEMETGYISEDTVVPLVQKAFREAKAVAVEGNLLAEENSDSKN
ncbi:50S ribosomal protein L10 [Candidatus Woesearchaeota archaeon]|nr:50S ribosomal protein L10 [Candidatus Woesearchaeota archaeon]